jgi:hypothetical protein
MSSEVETSLFSLRVSAFKEFVVPTQQVRALHTTPLQLNNSTTQQINKSKNQKKKQL